MFDIGWSEMAVIMLVALVVIGPKDLPRLARTLGQWVAKGRSMAREFQRSLEDMAREAELDDVKREIEKVGRTNIRKSIEKTIDPTGELGRAFDTNSGKAPIKALGAAPNGEAKEPAPAKPVKSEQPAKTAPAKTAKAEPATAPESGSKPRTAKSEASPKSAAEPKTDAKPQTEAKAKPAAKPRTSARSKTTTGNAPNAASSETAKAETMAEPH
jgi:sec-independent protein translocase protein TatB